MNSIDQAVARIVTHCQRPSWYTPWDPGQVEQSSGSGFIVDGGRNGLSGGPSGGPLIMTNAHVVADARLLLVFLHGDPSPHEAVVHAVGHDCDLAVLRLREPAVLGGREALPFGPLPALRSTVETFGYPAGGRQISSTRGVVSRIELQYYTHPENEQHLAVQTDAAINPGNSGGPVVQDGKVVGVAFQAAYGLQGTGYFIPSEVVRHFQIDAAGERYRGFPSLGVRVQNLENAAARGHAGMEEHETGVIVDLVYPQTSADGQLQIGDVLLAIDGMPIANDGSVALPPYPGFDGAAHSNDTLRMDLLVLVDRHQIGEVLRVRVLRAGRRIDLELPLLAWPAVDRYAAKHDRRPRYLVYGGLVFVPLDLETMKTFGKEWRYKADKILLHEFLIRPCAELDLWRKEQVVLLRRLDHAVNAGLSWHQNLPVERVNGRPIRGLVDLVEAFASETGPFHVLEFSGNRLVVLDRREAERANPEILEQYGVNVDRNL